MCFPAQIIGDFLDNVKTNADPATLKADLTDLDTHVGQLDTALQALETAVNAFKPPGTKTSISNNLAAIEASIQPSGVFGDMNTKLTTLDTTITALPAAGSA
jgi:hypothetical protein